MSHENTMLALVSHLKDNLPPTLTINDVAFEGEFFKPEGRDLWLACYYIPATEDTTGKDYSDNDVQRGIFQISIFTPLSSGQYSRVQLSTIDALKSAFRFGGSLVYNTQTVTTQECTVNNGSGDEAWFKRDISINYLTISKR